MIQKLNSFFSLVTHPLLLPAYALLLFFLHGLYLPYVRLEMQSKAMLLLFLLVAIITIILPISLFMLLPGMRKKEGETEELKAKQLHQSILGVFALVISYFFAYIVLNKMQIGIPAFIKLFLLCAALILIISGFLMLWINLSIHALAGGVLAGTMIAFGLLIKTEIITSLSLIVVISGITGSLRIHQAHHKPIEVYGSFVFGWAAMWGLLLINYQ